MKSLRKPLLVLAVVPAAVALLAGCGSKPEYCQKTDELKQSISDFGSSLKTANPDKISTAAANVENAGDEVIQAARTDYPQQTSSLRNTIDAVRTDINELSGSSDQAAVIANLGLDLLQLRADFSAFEKATSSDCG